MGVSEIKIFRLAIFFKSSRNLFEYSGVKGTIYDK